MDSEAVSALYRDFAQELIRSLKRRFPWSGDIVEDAVHHAFLQLQMRTEPLLEPRAWVRTVARNHVLDRLRADGKVVGDEVIDSIPAKSTATTSTSTGITPTLIQRAMLALTTRAQRLLRGKYQEDKSYGTLAREERLAKSGMGRILHRARQRLREAVDKIRLSRRTRLR